MKRSLQSWQVFLLICAASTLAGCGQARYYKEISETAIKEAKNLEAETLMVVPCLIGLGAFFRLDDETKKQALVMLCSNGQALPEPAE